MHAALPGAARARAPAPARPGAPAARGRRAASARAPCAARHSRRAPPPRAGSPGRGGDADYAAGGGADEPLAFDEDAYHRVGLHVVQATVDPPSGFLLFLREGDAPAEADDGAPGTRNREGIPKDLPKEGLAVSIGGDTFQALGLLLRREESPRPLSIHLLQRLLDRAAGAAPRSEAWGLLRVAVVGAAGDTFLGRAWFGGRGAAASAGRAAAAAWDVDCRPSDATWLALYNRAPMYVSKAVWAAHAADLAPLLGGGGGGGGGAGRASRGAAAGMTAAEAATTVFDDDPEPLVLLKMQLRLAIGEEDYEASARLRDHPYVRLHLEGIAARREGDAAAAARAEAQLEAAIEAAAEAGAERGRAGGEAA
jgi:bifunctional DNase/RNase